MTEEFALLDRPTTPDRPTADKFDAREINRKAVKHWSILYWCLVDFRGRPLGEIRALNPANEPLVPGGVRPRGLPQLTEFSGVSHWENADGSGPGSWHCRSTGASGPDAISVVQFLAGEGCERRVAADFLRRLVDRIAVVELR
jgi:hypothetical protein